MTNSITFFTDLVCTLNLQLEKDEVVTLLCVSPKVYPPHVTYAVRGHSPLTDLKCAVDVLGAQARGILQYVLTSTRPPNPTGIDTSGPL